MILKPVTKTIYVFDVKSQQNNDNGVIKAMKRNIVNQNTDMTTVWSKQWKYIIIILFLWCDTCNNADVYSQW